MTWFGLFTVKAAVVNAQISKDMRSAIILCRGDERGRVQASSQKHAAPLELEA
jgi:hypothetical protein